MKKYGDSASFQRKPGCSRFSVKLHVVDSSIICFTGLKGTQLLQLAKGQPGKLTWEATCIQHSVNGKEMNQILYKNSMLVILLGSN